MVIVQIIFTFLDVFLFFFYGKILYFKMVMIRQEGVEGRPRFTFSLTIFQSDNYVTFILQ